jgi:hypothetical protein
LLPPNDPLRWRAAEHFQLCERLLTLDRKLPGLLKGEAQPADAGERIDFAQLCVNFKGMYAASARLYAQAFAERPRVAEDLRAGHRYRAACAAALAGCGRGADAAGLDETERARWRGQARDWLRADLRLLAQRLDSGTPAGRAEVQKTLQSWLTQAQLACVRGAEALGKLPAEEREGWAKLWADVESLRQKVREKTK